MKVVLLDTSYPINSRNSKIIQSLSKSYPLAEIHQVTWDRNGSNPEIDNPLIHIYKKKSPTGKLWLKAKNLWGYKCFVHSIIRKIEPDIVIASHWDTLLIVPRLKRESQRLIYENLDVPTGRFRAVFHFLERWALKRTDLIIHASRFFKDLYPQSIKQIILENKPFFSVENRISYFNHKPLRIAYIGNIRYKNILFNLIESLRDNESWELTLYGGGVEYEEVKAYSGGISNVKMTGPYDYKNISKIYDNVDVIWAVYPNKDFNVKYAISNKFFESIYLNIPGIYAKDTMLGDYVVKNNIGMVINPYDIQDIQQLLSNVENGSINLIQMVENLKALALKQSSWDEDFEQIIDFINH